MTIMALFQLFLEYKVDLIFSYSLHYKCTHAHSCPIKAKKRIESRSSDSEYSSDFIHFFVYNELSRLTCYQTFQYYLVSNLLLAIPKTFVGQYFFYCWKTVILPFLCKNMKHFFVKNVVLGQTDLFNFKVGGNEKPVVRIVSLPLCMYNMFVLKTSQI